MDNLERTPKAFNSNARKKIYLLLQEEAGEKGMTLQDFLTSLKDRTKLNLRKMSQFFGYASIFHALQSLDDVLYYKKDPSNNVVYVYPRRKYLPGASPAPLSPLPLSSSSGMSPPSDLSRSVLSNSGQHTLFSSGGHTATLSPRTRPHHDSHHGNGGPPSGVPNLSLSSSGGYPTAPSKGYSLYGSGQHHFGPLLNVPPSGGHHSLAVSSPPFHGRHSPIPTAQTHFSSITHDMETVPPQSISPPLSPRRPMTPFTKEEIWMAREAGLIAPNMSGMDSDDFSPGETASNDDDAIALLNAAETIKILAMKHVSGYNAISAENAELKKQLRSANEANAVLKKELVYLMGNDLEGLNTEQLQSLKKTLKTALSKIKKQEFAQEMTQGQKALGCDVCWSKVETTQNSCGHKSVCTECDALPCPDCGHAGDKETFSAADATQIAENINSIIS